MSLKAMARPGPNNHARPPNKHPHPKRSLPTLFVGGSKA